MTWTMEYNGLNQLTKRYSGASWTGASGDVRYTYTYDTNGNLTGLKKETKIGSTWSQADRWAYTWTTRDQMKYATKYNGESPSPHALYHRREREPSFASCR